MKITKLSLTNVRTFKRAELKFSEGMNLLVGLNGYGKTTILDSIRTLLSGIVRHAGKKVRGDVIAFSRNDIRISTDALDAEIRCAVPGGEFVYSIHKPRQSFIVEAEKSEEEAILRTPEKRDMRFIGDNPRSAEQFNSSTLFALFFSTARSHPSDAQVSSRKSSGGVGAAYAGALSSRELLLAQTAYWMRSQEVLGRKLDIHRHHYNSLCRAASRFLPECKNLRPEVKRIPTLLVDKKVNGVKTTLNVKQLSDGERSMLALVLDLAQRLSQAYPDLTDPIKQGKAVVLIDELDLHLHPKWQRSIVDRLTKTFPKCQFIATTHSPQIVAAVEPEQIQLLTDRGIVRPERALGMDSNWILRHLMETDDRPVEVAKVIQAIEAAIDKHAFLKARKLIVPNRKKWPDLPDWAILETRIVRMESFSK